MDTEVDQIISAYAGLWADVLYNKNLTAHLKKMERDIAFIGMLVNTRNEVTTELAIMIRIQKQLEGMRLEILNRIGFQQASNQNSPP